MEWVKAVKGLVDFFKIGSELFTTEGSRAVAELKRQGLRVFLDLKFHDVPVTVSRALREVVRMQVDIVNVHAQGGEPMMRAAAEAVTDEAGKIGVARPRLIAVTLLTSLSQLDLEHLGVAHPLTQIVERLAKLAHRCGLDGAVCSPHEIPVVRRGCGKEFLLVTPGIRLPDSPADDQKRKATPQQAVEWGADYLVIGRPVWSSPDPVRTLESILGSLPAN